MLDLNGGDDCLRVIVVTLKLASNCAGSISLSIYVYSLVIVCAVSANVCVCMSDNMLKNAHSNSNPNRDLSGATKRGRKRMIEMDVAIFLSYLVSCSCVKE